MIESYLQQAKEALSTDDLAKKTYLFLKEETDSPILAVMKHLYHPRPFIPILFSDAEFDAHKWADSFTQANYPDPKNPFIKTNDYINYIPGQVPPFKVNYIFVFKEDLSRVVIDLLATWQTLQSMLRQIRYKALEDNDLTWANLISQLLHDSHSLVDMIPKACRNDELDIRRSYQRKVNNRLLFLIRPLELLPIRMPVDTFISDSLQMIHLKAENFTLQISANVSDIIGDAELLSRAFNEIITNSLMAVSNDYTKISIKIDTIPPVSPLLPFDWLRIVIRDGGSGIHKDFLKRVTEPFFTTRKYEGYTGLGLSIAKKIIESHHGQLLINSVFKKGTEVTLYLPLNDTGKDE